jgi:hypothetical protein
MVKSFRTLDDVDVKGKRVLPRVDLNAGLLECYSAYQWERCHKGAFEFWPAHFAPNQTWRRRANA